MTPAEWSKLVTRAADLAEQLWPRADYGSCLRDEDIAMMTCTNIGRLCTMAHGVRMHAEGQTYELAHATYLALTALLDAASARKECAR